MAKKTPEIGLYVEDIPMKLSIKYKPLDLSAYIEDETQIPDLFSEDYKFSAELYALEVAELRDKEKVEQLKQSMSKINLQNNRKINSDTNGGNDSSELLSATQLSPQLSSRENERKPMKQMVTSIHLNAGEILKPLTNGTKTILSDNCYNMSDNSIDSNVNIKKKIVNNTKKINPKDFENDTSSPFDNVELQTIDDMQELNDVFQAFHNKPKQHSTQE